jgi:hypothetical protein
VRAAQGCGGRDYGQQRPQTVWHDRVAPAGIADERALLRYLPPRKMEVYIFRSVEPVIRLIGSSDILYIGSATNARGLQQRVRQYYHPGPTQRTHQKIKAYLELNAAGVSVGHLVRETAEDALDLERLLLETYYWAHGDLPPLNTQLPRYRSRV